MPANTGTDDSIVLRLAGLGKEADMAFLGPHHLAAAARFESLIRRAQMVPRTTMSYDPTKVGGGSRGGNGVESASDAAAQARLRLSQIAGALPTDCWGVLFDVCGLGKGLQMVETERRWPRRSAKLVLRIALDQLAAQFGLSATGQGPHQSRQRGWLDQRPAMFAETEA